MLCLLAPATVAAQTPSHQANETTIQAKLDLADKYFSQGNDLFGAGNYPDAITAYDKALALNPNDTDSLYQKGRALNNLGKYEEAILSYDKVLEIDPANTDVLRSKGITLENLGNHSEAISYYDKVLSIDPKDTAALYRKGLTLENLTRYNEAISNYDKALAIDPTDTDVLYHKGLALENLGNHSGAISYYDKVLAIDPTNINVLNSKNFAEGKPALEQAKGSNLDQNLLIAVTGLFVVLAAVIIYFDKAKKKKLEKAPLPLVRDDFVSTASGPKLLQQYEVTKATQVKKSEITYDTEKTVLSQKTIAIGSEMQPILEMVRKLQQYNIGNSIMLEMIRKSLEENKPVSKLEIDYVQQRIAELEAILKSRKSEN